MEHGLVFPQTEIGPDPIVVRDYVQAAEEIGYTHLVICKSSDVLRQLDRSS